MSLSDPTKKHLLKSSDCCSCCSACPAALFCMTGNVFVSFCVFCGSAVSVRGTRTVDDFGLVKVGLPGGNVEGGREELILLRDWEKWKNNRVIGVRLDEIPARSRCQLYNTYTLNIAMGESDICKPCFEKIEKAMYAKELIETTGQRRSVVGVRVQSSDSGVYSVVVTPCYR